MADLQVKVVPGASRSRIAGKYGDGIKVQLSAPPEKGKANAALVELLAEALGVRGAQVTIVSGHTQPRKTVRVEGMSEAALKEALEKLAGG